MGAHYVNSTLVALLSFGFLAENAYQPLNNILFALNFHGRPSLATAAGAACALLGVGAVLGSGSHELSSVALAVVIPWSLAHGVYVPVYACRRLELPLWTFLKQAWMGPLACVDPVWRLFARRAMDVSRKTAGGLGVGGLSGTLVLLTFFWFWSFLNGGKTRRQIYSARAAYPSARWQFPEAEEQLPSPSGSTDPWLEDHSTRKMKQPVLVTGAAGSSEAIWWNCSCRKATRSALLRITTPRDDGPTWNNLPPAYWTTWK